MSSHHFVKEGQEPALLILEATSYTDAEGLLEWAPLVLVAETALDQVLLWGIKVDVVICHPQNETNLTSALADQAPVRIFSAGEDLTESSLLYITRAGQRAVSIMAIELSGKLRDKIERFAGDTRVTVRTAAQKWAFIPSGHYKKWYQGGSIIDFSDKSLFTAVTGVARAGSGYELTEDQWVNIENSAPFWVSEEL